MPQSTILAAAEGEALSTDVAVAAGSVATLSMFSASGGVSQIAVCVVYLKTPGDDNEVERLTAQKKSILVNGPGTYRVRRISGNVGVSLDT